MDTQFEPIQDVEIKPKAIRLRSKALREIRDQQKNTKNIIPIAPFQRLVHGIASEYIHDVRIKKDAMQALQADAEAMLIDMFSDANMTAINCGRETVAPEDIQFLKSIGKYNY